MATIIDALVVTLGLDDSGYRKGQANSRNAIKSTKDDALTAAKEMEAAGKRAASYFSQLKAEAVGLFLAFTGASSLLSFATGLVTSAADAQRLGDNLGVATEKVAAWEGAVQSVGGKAGDADAALRSLAKAYQDYQILKTLPNSGDYRALGITNPEQLKDPTEALLRFASARERMSAPEFYNRMSRLGIPESVINSLQKGRKATEAMIAEQERVHPVTDKDADAAVALQKSINELVQVIEGKLQPVLTRIVEFLAEWFGASTDAASGADAVKKGADGATPAIDAAGKAAETTGKKFKEAGTHAKTWGEIMADIGRGAYTFAFGKPPSSGTESVGDGVAQGAGAGASLMRSLNRGRGGGAGGGGSADPDTEAFFRSRGWSAEQSRGLAHAIKAEGGTPTAFNRAGGGQGARGIGQWRGPRLKQFRQRYGKDVLQASKAEQLDFYDWELRNTERAAGNAIRQQSTAYGAGEANIRLNMRAGPDGYAGDMSRMRRSLGMAGAAPRSARGGGASTTTTTVGTINVHTAATDAGGIARDIHGALRSRQVVAQANRGLD